MNTIEEQLQAAIAGNKEVKFQRPSGKTLVKAKLAITLTLMSMEAAGKLVGWQLSLAAAEVAHEMVLHVTLH